METTNTRQDDKGSTLVAFVRRAFGSARPAAPVEIVFNDLDQLPNRWARSAPYEMPTLGWRYG